MISLLKILFLKFSPVFYTFLSPPFLFCPHFKLSFRYVGGMGFSNVGEMDGYMQ